MNEIITFLVGLLRAIKWGVKLIIIKLGYAKYLYDLGQHRLPWPGTDFVYL